MEERILHSADLAPLLVADASGGFALQQPVQSSANDAQTHASEIVFVDLSVPDADALLSDLRAQRDSGRALEIVTIAADQDGLALISETLATRHDIRSVHVLAHGSDGMLQLGNSRLDAQSLLARAGEVAGWGAAMTADADLLLYGCDFTQTAIGQQMVRDLAALTGADVAASSDPTGAAARGGNWVLEQHSGDIEATSIASATLQQAWGGLLGNDFGVNTTTGNTQSTDALNRGSQQAVAYDTSGNFVVVWTSDSQDGSGEGVYARRFDVDGNALTGEIRVAQTTASDQNSARVASDGNGRFVVTWTSNNQDGDKQGVYVRRFDAAGNALTNELLVNTTTSGVQTNSVIGMNASSGDFVIAWQGNGSGDSAGVFFRRFAANGSALDASERRGNLASTGSEQNAAVAMDASGRFVIAWDEGGDAYFQRFDASGSAQGAAVQFDMTLTTGSGAAIAMDGAGNFTIVFRVSDLLAINNGVWARGYLADGTSRFSPVQIASGNATSPSIAMINDGSFVVAYQKTGSDGLDIFARRYSAGGTAAGAAVPVNQYITNDQSSAAVAMRDDGNNFVVVWSGKSVNDSRGVNARVFTTELAPVITSNGGGASAAISLPENTLAVTTVTATDANGDTLSYSISGGTDQSRFSIDAVTGVLSFVQAPDYENPVDSNGDNIYQVQVRVSDGALTASQTLTVTVTNVVSELKVTTVADVLDGNVGSIGLLINNPGADGKISLREAILAANATAGTDSIVFDIAGSGPHVISLLSLLPQISGTIQLLGFSEPDVAGNGGLPVVVIDGNDLSGDGLVLQGGAAGSTISGLVIRNFNGNGITLHSGANNTVITGNLIGRFNTSGGDAGASKANSGAGIYVNSANNTIGGNTSNSRNVIAGNTLGILLDGSNASGNWVAGNRIGTNAAGTLAIGNAAQGILLRAGANNNTIGSNLDGSFDALEGNQIVGSGDSAIQLWDSTTLGNRIRGNLLGSNAAGTALLGQNLTQGIQLGGGAHDNMIGGTAALAGNTVVGSKFAGIELTLNATANTVHGNFIGTNAAGALSGGNGTFGIYISNGAFNNLIGGATEGAVNWVMNNAGDGIGVAGSSSVGNAILGNQIDGNGGLGISLGGVNPTNDVLDADGGANDLQNYPVLAWADVQSGNTVISGVLDSKANTSYRIEFFSSPAADASGYGEGRVFLGASTVTTNAAGRADLLVTFNGVAVAAGHAVSATATVDLGSGTYRSTSAFGPTVVATVDNATPVISSDGGADTAAIAIPENTTVVTTVGAGSSNGNPISYSISGGADANKFNINASTGVLNFVGAPDFENPTDAGGNNVYDVIVSARSGGLTDTQAIAVTVTDVDGPLTITTTLDVYDGDVSSIEALIANQGADGLISLREAITAANNTPGTDTINLPAGNYVLTRTGSAENFNVRGDLDVRANLVIIGDGAATTSISAGGGSGVFEVVNGRLTMSGVTIRDGNASNGAGIAVNSDARLDLSQSVLRNNTASSAGGAIQGDSDSTITLTQVDILNNAAQLGGGVYVYRGTLTAVDTSFDGNSASKWGGGLYNDRSDANLTRVTVSNNTASLDGAGLYVGGSSGTLSVVNSTLSGNTATGVGGALYADRAITITASTIAFNSASSGGGMYLGSQGSASLGSSIVAGNTGGNSNKTLTSLGYNLDSGSSLGLNQGSDRSNTDPLLAALANNGGYTRTHALLDGSAALDTGNPSAPATDQRGVARFLQADIGAYEADASINRRPVNTLPASVAANEDTQLAISGASVADANEAGAVAANKILDTRLSVSNGVLSVALAGGATATGNGSATLTLSGSQADINATLASLRYQANLNYFGSDSLVMLSRDGAGLSDSDTIAITVAAANDAPTGTSAAIALFKNGSTTLTRASFGFADSAGESNGFKSVLLQLPSAGELLLGGAVLTLPTEVTVAQLDAGQLVYRPTAGGAGAPYATLMFQVRDDGGTANGGTDLDPVADTLTFNVTNRAPAIVTDGGGANASTNVTENTTAVTTVAASDADADAISYSIDAVGDGAKFSIDAGTGVLRFIVAPNFEVPTDVDLNNIYLVTVRATDTSGAFASQTLSVTVTDVHGAAGVDSATVWFTTAGAQTTTAGGTTWNSGTVLQYGNAGDHFDTDGGSTTGTVDKLAGFATPVPLRGLYYVQTALTVGGFALAPGDLLLVLDPGAGTVTLDGIAFDRQDVAVFRPSVAGNYSSGSYSMLLDNGVHDASTNFDVHAIALVETATTIGGTTLASGTFLVANSTPGGDMNVYTFDASSTGVGSTVTGDMQLLLDGAVLGISTNQIQGLQLLSGSAAFDETVLPAGTLLVAVNGSNPVAGVAHDGLDILALTVTQTQQDASAGTTATATVLFDGSDLGMSGGESINVSGLTVITQFASNSAPTVSTPLVNQNATQDQPFSYGIAGTSFTDGDAGDTLTYSATLDSGAVLPSWLMFDAGTRVFSGTPANGDVAVLTVRVTAKDGSNASVFGDFTLTVNNVNDPPTLSSPIADQAATQGMAFSFTVPAGSFTDIDAGDSLNYSATLADGSALPAWLMFDAGLRKFTGTPANADVGAIQVRVTATDTSAAKAFDDFTLTVADANDAPTVAVAIPDQNATEGAAFLFVLPAGSFADLDAGDTLTYSASLVGGGALPTWLNFDAATQTFSGTPGNDDTGSVAVRVTATDSGLLSVSDDFDLSVASVNDAPQIADPGVILVAEDSASAITGIIFSDIDAGASTVRVTMSVERGTLSASSGGGVVAAGGGSASITLDGTISDLNTFIAGGQVMFSPVTDDTADDILTTTIDDLGNSGLGGAQQANAQTRLTVDAVNDPPSANAPASIAVTEDTPLALTGISFADVDANANPVTATFSVGSGTLSASSGAGVTVGGSASALTMTGSITDINAFIAAGALGFVGAPDATANVMLTSSINDNGNTGSGGPLSASAVTTLVMTAVNDAPTVNAPPSFAATEDMPLTLTGIVFADVDAGANPVTATFSIGSGALAATSGGGVTVGGTANTLTLTGSVFDINGFIAAGNLSFIPTGDMSGTLTLTSSINDNGNSGSGGALSAAALSSLTVGAVNDAPGVVAPLSFAVDEDVAIALTGISFADVDAGAGLLTATFNVGAGMLAASSGGGVTVVGNASSTLTLTGTLSDINNFIASGLLAFTGAANANGNVTLTSSINDNGNTGTGGASSASAVTTLTIAAINDAPTIGAPAGINVTEDVASAITGIVFADVDAGGGAVTASFTVGSGALAAASSGGVAVAGNASTLTLTGTLANVNSFLAAGRLTFTAAADSAASVMLNVTIDDGGNTGSGGALNAATAITLTVTVVNDAPTLANAIADQAATQGQAFSLTVAANTFADVDAGDNLTYSARQTNGAALPSWLYFDAASRTFSGTPANADVGALSVRVTATDNGALSASDDFVLTVANVNDAPLAMPLADQFATVSQTMRLELPAATFVDVDAGDSLQYTAALADGSALPVWLTFDPATRTFSGRPTLANLGTTSVRVVATDTEGASAQMVFSIVVAALADAPAIPLQEPTATASEKPAATQSKPESTAAAAQSESTQAAPAAVALEAAVASIDVLAPDNTQVVAFDTGTLVVAQRQAAFQFADIPTTPPAPPAPLLAAALLSQVGDITLSSSTQGYLKSDDMLRKLEEMRRQMAVEGSQQQLQVASAIALSSGISIGYVVWLIRGGVLVSSMLSALPAWQMLDPLPVIASSGSAPRKGRVGPAEDPEVERLFDDNSRAQRSKPLPKPATNGTPSTAVEQEPPAT